MNLGMEASYHLSTSKYQNSIIYTTLMYHRYIVATQDRELQDILRKVPGVPILYLHGKAPTLEAPSQANREYAEKIHKELGMTAWEKENIKTLKEAAGMIEQTEVRLKKKKRKGGPNPLSCLKKKKKPQTEAVKNITAKKSNKVQKRKKKKIAPHIKEVLVAEIKNKQIEKHTS